ncbi:MAG: hypothetical protein ACR2PL_06135 [Dehalococcoidia bacterium]
MAFAIAIDRWDIARQIDYIEEWTPKIGLARQLQQLIVSSVASTAHRVRFEELQHLMKKNKPILNRLRAS